MPLPAATAEWPSPVASAKPLGAPGLLAFGEFALDIGAQRLTHRGQPVALAPRYFAVLQHLAGSGGRLVGKDELLDAVWGHRHVSDSVLKVAINALRKALGDNPKAPRFVETVPRKGYRFLGTPGAGHQRIAAWADTHERPWPALGNLPALQPGLIGREDDARRLGQALAQHRLVTLHGPGGVGKTRLALAVAATAGAQAAGGAWLLRLDAMADAAPLLPSLARLLSLGPGAEADPAALARALGQLELLLVLDNAEHLIDAVAALAGALLAGAPRIRLLVTSQVPLRVAGEQVQALAPLPPPAVGDPQAAESAAVRLLLARVRQWQPDASLGARTLSDACAICLALDGLPLALELAAAKVPLLGWAGVRARLVSLPGDPLALLNRGQPGAAARQRTLRATLAWAYALLTPAQQHVLQCLSVFAGSFSVDAAMVVAALPSAEAASDPAGAAETVLDHLDMLREHALLVRVDGADETPRWRLFDSVRGFAAQALLASGGRDATLGRLLAQLSGMFEQALPRFFDMPLARWVAMLEPEADTLRHALQVALAQPALQTQGVALFAHSALFRVRAGFRPDARRDLQAVQALMPLALDAPAAAALDLALAGLSAYAQLVPPPQALGCARRAQTFFGASGDAERATWACYLEGALLIRLQSPLAERRQALERLQAIEPAHWTAMQRRHSAWQLASLLRDEGDDAGHDQACAAYMALGRTVGDSNLVWTAAQSLAQTWYAQGREGEATDLWGQTVADMRAAGQLRANAQVLAQWAAARIGQASTPQTLASLHEAAQLLQAENRLWWMADALAWPLAWRGQWDDAARVQAWADGLVARAGEKRGRLFGGLRRRFGDWLDAQPMAGHLQGLLACDPHWDEAMVMAAVFGQNGRS